MLLQAALLKRSKRPPREAYIATLVVLGLVIASVLATPTMQSVASGNNATKAKESEAKTYVGSLNRAQQSYFLENVKFTNSIADLNLGIRSETENYSYSIETQGSVAVSKGSARRDGLKSYTGTVFLLKLEGSNENTTQTILCKSKDKTKTAPDAAELIDNKPKCAKNSEAI